MIHVISFNSTGVGVYTIQHVSVARTNSEAVLNLVLNIFLNKKLHGIIWALLLPSQHFVHGHLNGASNIDLHSPTVIPLL